MFSSLHSWCLVSKWKHQLRERGHHSDCKHWTGVWDASTWNQSRWLLTGQQPVPHWRIRMGPCQDVSVN